MNCDDHDPSLFRPVVIWSKAGIGTSLIVETKPIGIDGGKDRKVAEKNKDFKGTRIVFDIGATPCFDESIKSSIVIISHGHIDHIGAIFSHARAHVLTMGGNPATYYVPSALVPSLQDAREAMSKMDNLGSGERNLLKMNIVGVEDGDEIELKQKKNRDGIKLFLRAFSVDHCGCPALGYTIVSKKLGGLKDEYKGLPPSSMRELVKSGVNIKADPVEKVEVAYTGDTCAQGIEVPHHRQGDGGLGQKRLDYLKQAFLAPLIFCELTFIEHEQKELAHSRGHIHIDDILPLFNSHGFCLENQKSSDIKPMSNKDDFKHEKILVFLHFSGRYCALKILDKLWEKLPKSLQPISHLAISSFLTKHRNDGRYDKIKDLMEENGCISLKRYSHLQSENPDSSKE